MSGVVFPGLVVDGTVDSVVDVAVVLVVVEVVDVEVLVVVVVVGVVVVLIGVVTEFQTIPTNYNHFVHNFKRYKVLSPYKDEKSIQASECHSSYIRFWYFLIGIGPEHNLKFTKLNYIM